MEKLQEWMSEKVYGLNGTKDKTLKIRGNPKVFFDMTIPTYYLTTSPPTTLLLPSYLATLPGLLRHDDSYRLPHYLTTYYLTTTLLPCYLTRSSST